MPSQIVNDGTLIRGSAILAIGGNNYIATDIKDDLRKARTEKDYDAEGRFNGASHAEDARMLTANIRARTDQPDPPKFTTFTYDGVLFYIVDSEKSGSTQGLKVFAVTIMEQKNATLTIT